ncbi:MAG: ribbon-helix-helix domain-containing protein [Alphaproteobacteria bacterium]|nr:ribbon-helix-helix domain-containing protein [Alphaproteobacteria bacterium]
MEDSAPEKGNQNAGEESKTSKSTLVSRNITIMGRRTSVRLEPEMWMALKEIAKRERCSIHDICSLISLRKNENTSLTAAIRVFLMLYFRASSTEEGHMSAGHGSFETMKQRAKIEPNVQFKHFPKNEDDYEEVNARHEAVRYYDAHENYSEKRIN